MTTTKKNLKREEFKTSKISEQDNIKYYIHYTNNEEIEYYTLHIEEFISANQYRDYTFRWIKDLEYAKYIAEHYKNYTITDKDQDKFYSANDMRWF